MNTMIKAIVYDAVGTLIHVHPAVSAIYAEVGRRFGSKLDAADVQRRFHKAFARQDQRDADARWRTDEAREVERWREIVGEVLDDVDDAASCFAALFEAFGEQSAWRCDPAAADVMTEMNRRSMRQAIASNFDRRLRNVIAPMPIAPFLDAVIISSEIGWRKPALAFFTHVAAALDKEPNEILFVGDDRTNDFEAANAAGMHAVIFDPHRRHLDVGRNRVERLQELLMMT